MGTFAEGRAYMKFQSELIKKESQRLNKIRRQTQKFCPTCGRIIERKDILCDWCRGGSHAD
jgi:hypothetical protein